VIIQGKKEREYDKNDKNDKNDMNRSIEDSRNDCRDYLFLVFFYWVRVRVWEKLGMSVYESIFKYRCSFF